MKTSTPVHHAERLKLINEACLAARCYAEEASGDCASAVLEDPESSGFDWAPGVIKDLKKRKVSGILGALADVVYTRGGPGMLMDTLHDELLKSNLDPMDASVWNEAMDELGRICPFWKDALDEERITSEKKRDMLASWRSNHDATRPVPQFLYHATQHLEELLKDGFHLADPVFFHDNLQDCIDFGGKGFVRVDTTGIPLDMVVVFQDDDCEEPGEGVWEYIIAGPISVDRVSLVKPSDEERIK